MIPQESGVNRGKSLLGHFSQLDDCSRGAGAGAAGWENVVAALQTGEGVMGGGKPLT